MNQPTQPIQASRNIALILTLAAGLLSLNAFAQAPKKRRLTKTALDPRMAHAADQQVVARVNGDPVTRGELERLRADPREEGLLLLELGVEHPSSKEMEGLALRKLINRRLILQEAARRHYIITDEELDQAVTALRRRFEDLRSFGAWMQEQGLDDRSLVEGIRADMLSERVRAALVEGVRVTGDEVQEYFESHKEDLKTEEVWLQIVVVKDRATANEILAAALQKGQDFGDLARQRSVGRRAAQGGDLGWINSETLWPPLRAAVAALKPHEATGPLQKGAEFLVVRLEERRRGRSKSLAEAKPEIQSRLLIAKRQEAVRAWLSEQVKISKIEVLPQTRISDAGTR